MAELWILIEQNCRCWVFLLPICDRYHLITLDDQLVKIKPVSGTLNSRCGPYGIHVKEVTIDGLVLLRPPPSHNSKSNIELVTKHLHQLSCVLLNSRGDKPLIKPPTSQSNVEQQIINLSNGSEQTNSTSMSCDTTDIISDPEITTTTITNESSSVETTPLINKVQKQYSFKSLNTLSQLRISHNYPALSKAITRAQGLLNSNIACQALDCASLQLVISMENKFVKDHLPLLNSVENRNFILLYLDAGTGTVGSGCLPVDKQPANVTLFIHIDDLTDVVEGRLDVINAIKSDKAFMTGSLSVLSKMRHLLYLPPV
uniref:Uncharacterized protein n=1 Tax=Schistosoma haematobium TaxID=6185 RepID=A0A095C386_SCHHA